MNIQTSIDSKLWEAVKSSYEAKNFCHAINDAIHFLTDVIREKSGFDDDGVSLVSKSFGGDNPVIKLNKFQTQTEKDIQRGTEALLRGIYQAIKNPRSHEQINDNEKNANTIILFIDFLILTIDKAKPPFDFYDFLDRVNDKYFVTEQEYVEELVHSIPIKKHLEVLIELLRYRRGSNIKNSILVIRNIISLLDEDQLREFLHIVSEGLKVADDYASIRITLGILDNSHWKSIDKSSMLRLDNILLKSTSKGKCNSCDSVIDDEGAIATFGREFIIQFGNLAALRKTIIKKLNSDYSEQFYVFCFFLQLLPKIFNEKYQMEFCVKDLCRAVQAEESFVDGGLKSKLVNQFYNLPSEWRDEILKLIPEIENDVDIPF